MKPDELISAAINAREGANAKYSSFKVGAAFLTKSGKIFTGSNVESSSYSLTICAERVALTKALSEGERDFSAVAVVTDTRSTPCGACRQLMWDYAGDIPVYVADTTGKFHEIHLSELLPYPFEDTDLRKHGENDEGK